MRVETEPLKKGLAGVEQTVAKLTKLIREGAKNPFIIEEARRAVRRARPADTAAEWQELWNYITGLQGMPYRFDPVDVEMTYAAHLGGVAGGDCDDFTVRCGAMLEALGYPVKVEVGGRTGTNGLPVYHHVYAVVMDPRTGKWSTFDPVLDKPGRYKAKPGERLQTQHQRRYSMHTDRMQTPTFERHYARGPRPVRRREGYGYSEMSTDGFSQLGSVQQAHAEGYAKWRPRVAPIYDGLDKLVGNEDGTSVKLMDKLYGWGQSIAGWIDSWSEKDAKVEAEQLYHDYKILDVDYNDPSRPWYEKATERTLLYMIASASKHQGRFKDLDESAVEATMELKRRLEYWGKDKPLLSIPRVRPVVATVSQTFTPAYRLNLDQLTYFQPTTASPDPIDPLPLLVPSVQTVPSEKMSAGAKVALGVGAAVGTVGLAYLVIRKKQRRRRR